MKKIVLTFSCLLLLAVVALYADTPAQNINASKHPNLAKAQHLVNLAYQKVIDAQKANEYDLGGHADKAKSYLEQTNDHLKQAALAAKPDADGIKENVTRPEDIPEPTVSETKHPNMAKAQSYIESAYTSIVAAQKANEYDLSGHAEKAKTALEQAQKELKLAAQAANK